MEQLVLDLEALHTEYYSECGLDRTGAELGHQENILKELVENMDKMDKMGK